MNEANQITNATRLYGFIAEEAQQNRFAVTLNKRFKAAGDDAMMIPMNIRPDDFYFTLSNMKQSHLNGAVIGKEYRAEAMEVVDSVSELSERCGICDTVSVKDGVMHGELLWAGALKAVADKSGAERIAILGATPLAGGLALLLREKEVAMFDPWIEELMALQSRLGAALDINRLAEGMATDLSGYDLLFDLSELPQLGMITALPKLNVDLAPPRSASALRRRCTELDAAYSGYDALLETLTESVYHFVTKDIS